MYLPNSCEASSDSFLLPSNGKLTQDIASKNLSIKFVKFWKEIQKKKN